MQLESEAFEQFSKNIQKTIKIELFEKGSKCFHYKSMHLNHIHSSLGDI